MLQNNATLKNKITQLWNKFWSGGISNPLTAIEQITYLLFMKRIDDLDIKKLNESKNADKLYTSIFEGHWIPPEHIFKIDEDNLDQEAQKQKEEKEKPFRIDKETLRWNYFKQMPADEMLNHVQTNVFPFIKTLRESDGAFTKYMKNAVFIISKPALLVEAISTIDEIFLEIEKDTKVGGQSFQDIQGDVYEMLLSEIATAGKNGQFRTPRHIIKLIVELVNPQFGNRIADPACGTGGFLLGAYQYMATQLDDNKIRLKPDEDGFIRTSESNFLDKERIELLNDSLHGYDIDVTMVRLGLMNLMMHGVDAPHVNYKDTLSKGFDESDQYHIILANPPFTGSVDKKDINRSLKLKTTKTELLFLETIYNMLKFGGTAGVIVPQGVLFSEAKAFVEVRKLLVEKCELNAIITMPVGIFKPYAGVSTAILIFTKGLKTENVWFYDMESDGYSLDDRRTKLEGHGDLQDIILKYNQRKSQKINNRTDKFFSVPLNEIIAENYDFSISTYKEYIFEEIVYEKPSEIFSRLDTIENEISTELHELKEMLE